MKKAEMEAHDAAYQACMARARAAEARGLFRLAVETAESAWPYLDGMVQYRTRYADEEEFDGYAAVDMVLKYAPLLLDLKRLDHLDQLLDDFRRIVRNASVDLREQVAAARSRLWENHRLWGHLENNPGCPQDGLREALGGDQARWRFVAESWEKMGLLNRVPEGRSYRLSLSTRLGEIVRGKCPACGHMDEAPKGMFLEQTACPVCRERVVYVLLSNTGHVEMEG